MLLWVIFAVLTAGAALAVLVPLSRSPSPAAAGAAHEAAVYRDQLAELDRDRERGLVDAREAKAAHAEIARRFLRAAEAAETPATVPPALRRLAAAAAVVGIPLFTLSVYLAIGAPDAPDRPLAARLASAEPDANDVPALIARVERHLAGAPDDVAGWRLIAPVYLQLGDFARAADAWRAIRRLEGATPDTDTHLAEALILAGEGTVPADAQALLEGAVSGDPSNVAARFYLARSRAEEGRYDEAEGLLSEALASAPGDAPWRPQVEALRAEIVAAAGGSAAPGPSASDVAAAEAMTPADRTAMIEGMVAGLAARLAEEPGDRDGWLRLMRAYAVLGQDAAAATALADARRAFAGDPDTLTALDSAARDLGIAANAGE